MRTIAQRRTSDTWLPDETVGLENIVEALVTAFDHNDILGLGENHWNKLDSDLRIALVRNPGFRQKVRFIVVECASTADQPIIDRYIDGDDVLASTLQRVWTNTTQTSNVWESPVYADFLAAVRDVNKGLPPAGRIRVLAGDPPSGSSMDRDASAVSVLEKNVLKKHAKALIVYGSRHLERTDGITSNLERKHRGLRMFVVYTLGGPQSYFSDNFEPALKSRVRPVLVSLKGSPSATLVLAISLLGNFSMLVFIGAPVPMSER